MRHLLLPHVSTQLRKVVFCSMRAKPLEGIMKLSCNTSEVTSFTMNSTSVKVHRMPRQLWTSTQDRLSIRVLVIQTLLQLLTFMTKVLISLSESSMANLHCLLRLKEQLLEQSVRSTVQRCNRQRLDTALWYNI
mmetsp:Transcript_4185/g.12037  ORF Transcript_4185/g.12037 Transcript_4185/m.12037 type:complete len:134 (-) Transcript_4185:1110-1511(-)